MATRAGLLPIGLAASLTLGVMPALALAQAVPPESLDDADARKANVFVKDAPEAPAKTTQREPADDGTPYPVSAFKLSYGTAEPKDRPDLADNEYRGLELSSNGGRVVVRGWFEGRFTELLDHVVSWFDDLAIVHQQTGAPAPAPKFYAVLNTAFRDPDDIVPPLETSLFRAALLGSPIPEPFHTKVLLRIRAQVSSGDSITYVQAGLLKAFHRRRKQYMPNPELDLNGPTPYQCGRLLAILANLQRAALGDVGAGVVERFYPAASSTPALVLGRLILNAQNHLQALRGDKPGLSKWFDQRLADILRRVPVNSLPKILSLEDQSLFALGYYHQKAAPSRESEE